MDCGHVQHISQRRLGYPPQRTPVDNLNGFLVHFASPLPMKSSNNCKRYVPPIVRRGTGVVQWRKQLPISRAQRFYFCIQFRFRCPYQNLFAGPVPDGSRSYGTECDPHVFDDAVFLDRHCIETRLGDGVDFPSADFPVIGYRIVGKRYRDLRHQFIGLKQRLFGKGDELSDGKLARPVPLMPSVTSASSA